ncbi:MAG: hypothetical protein EBY17_31105 [Acidobacteriia bacterium]|nr:hypothetical protein [Terriglobia bacterium]
MSFTHAGYHVLRGTNSGSFGAFRCGTILDRFSQIDMLHVDIWWKGQNVLTDGGSYRYNGATPWHNYFLRTEGHNTVKIDGRDQMLHFRQFKTLYWTEAKLLSFHDTPAWALTEGEHYGYQRERKCTHRRSILFLKDDLWVCVDTVIGSGDHSASLQWLCGEFPQEFDAGCSELTLATPEGPFSITILNEKAEPYAGVDVVVGQESPPRGWLSRYYGQKTPVPSLAATVAGSLPLTLVSILAGGKAVARLSPSKAVGSAGQGETWTVDTDSLSTSFRLVEGRFQDIEVRTGQPQ